MAKYQVNRGFEDAEVCTIAPEYRNGDGRFVLNKCTQRDLRYLYEVIKHEAVVCYEKEKSAETAEQ